MIFPPAAGLFLCLVFFRDGLLSGGSLSVGLFFRWSSGTDGVKAVGDEVGITMDGLGGEKGWDLAGCCR
jgi:hypothetical protein